MGCVRVCGVWRAMRMGGDGGQEVWVNPLIDPTAFKCPTEIIKAECHSDRKATDQTCLEHRGCQTSKGLPWPQIKEIRGTKERLTGGGNSLSYVQWESECRVARWMTRDLESRWGQWRSAVLGQCH